MPRKEITRSEYYRRIGLVLDYIFNHLDSNLSLDKLAEIACFSSFHWHRIYQSITHENIANTIRRLRLHRAARALAETQAAVPKIAKYAGYTHADSFVRKFTQDFGITPAQYRKKALQQSHHVEPELEYIPTLKFAALAHSGDYFAMDATFARLRMFGEQQSFLTKESRAFGIFYSDPAIVKTHDLRSHACYTIHPDCPLGEGVEPIHLKAQTYATIIHRGPHHELDAAYRWLYECWLINSGYEPSDSPVLEEYLNSPRLVAPKDLLTKIYLPITKE